MTAMVLLWRRCRKRIGAPIAVSRAFASSCAHKPPLVTGTPSSATCGASTANQHCDVWTIIFNYIDKRHVIYLADTSGRSADEEVN